MDSLSVFGQYTPQEPNRVVYILGARFWLPSTSSPSSGEERATHYKRAWRPLRLNSAPTSGESPAEHFEEKHSLDLVPEYLCLHTAH